MHDDFGNDLFNDEAFERSVEQNWKVIVFFGFCDADHKPVFARDNAF
ncbi:hypothetical protein [Burkholderia mayonis]|nr:hypothetical protein [Burkholderia mayonis]